MSARKEEKISPEKIEEFLNDQEKKREESIFPAKLSQNTARSLPVSAGRQMYPGADRFRVENIPGKTGAAAGDGEYSHISMEQFSSVSGTTGMADSRF